VSPRVKKLSGAVLLAITLLGAAAGAAASVFNVGADVQAVRSDVVQHGRRLDIVEAKIEAKASVEDVRESEARIKEAMRESVDVLRADIREIRARR
jgi:hypothetical protein